jgi:hypothetical protein
MAPKIKFDDLNSSTCQQDVDCSEMIAAMSVSCENTKESNLAASQSNDTQSSYPTYNWKAFFRRSTNSINDQFTLSRCSSLSDITNNKYRTFTNKTATKNVSKPKKWKIGFSATTIVVGIILYVLSFICTIMNFHRNFERDVYLSIYRKGSVVLTKFTTQEKNFNCTNITSFSSSEARQLSHSITRPMILPPEHEPEPIKWKVKSDVVLKQLSYPIFMPSMPKSGTTSLWKFFQCGGQKSSHNWIKVNSKSPSTLSGVCIEDNIRHGLPPFHNCGDVDVYTDTGVGII